MRDQSAVHDHGARGGKRILEPAAVAEGFKIDGVGLPYEPFGRRVVMGPQLLHRAARVRGITLEPEAGSDIAYQLGQGRRRLQEVNRVVSDTGIVETDVLRAEMVVELVGRVGGDSAKKVLERETAAVGQLGERAPVGRHDLVEIGGQRAGKGIAHAGEKVAAAARFCRKPLAAQAIVVAMRIGVAHEIPPVTGIGLLLRGLEALLDGRAAGLGDRDVNDGQLRRPPDLHIRLNADRPAGEVSELPA